MLRRLCCCVFVVLASPVAWATPFAIHRTPGKVAVELDGKPLTTLHHGPDTPKVFLHPLRAASGLIVSRGYPVELVDGEKQDHKWHRGLWVGHGDVNGVDCWRELRGDPVKDAKLKLPIGAVRAVGAPTTRIAGGTAHVSIPLGFFDAAGKRLGGMTQAFAFGRSPGHNVIDVRVTLTAEGTAALVMGDTEEGFFGVRLADEFREERGAVLTNAEGQRSSEAIWGKRSRWVDYSTRRNGEEVGVAVFDHPANPRHPTYWHARGYGLCAANPFGERDFTRDPGRDGRLVIPPGKSASFRYRVVIHQGMGDRAALDRLYEAYRRVK